VAVRIGGAAFVTRGFGFAAFVFGFALRAGALRVWALRAGFLAGRRALDFFFRAGIADFAFRTAFFFEPAFLTLRFFAMIDLPIVSAEIPDRA
jgi:hypothetical protein